MTFVYVTGDKDMKETLRVWLTKEVGDKSGSVINQHPVGPQIWLLKSIGPAPRWIIKNLKGIHSFRSTSLYYVFFLSKRMRDLRVTINYLKL
ncbi:hypothetical protein RclHR1_01890019 [Rhizophagus clarus]|uniref:Uncharacterized protein n=1 Tax=Rhizophagus clarus TaxID=94130 RepID=A0A2Z6QPV0_9GLOM|nr:hypothetical protein RclHR1_01890019 [Rhizophagus clarus]